MPAQPTHQPESILADFFAEQKTIFLAQFPKIGSQFFDELASAVQADPETVQKKSSTTTTEKKLTETISFEEHQYILQKLAEQATLPQKTTEQEATYLEQQLAELLNLPITSELAEHKLPHTTIALKRHDPWKMSATDRHGVARSLFGWPHYQTAFSVALPLHTTPSWLADPLTAREWYATKQVILINPLEAVAVVCQIADVYLGPITQYQATATPAVIQAGKFWSRTTQGKALVFFIDTTEFVPFGPRLLEWKK